MHLLKNIIYFSASILLFFVGVIVYGIVLNSSEKTLAESMNEKGLNKFGKVYIVVERNSYRLNLYSDSILVKSYKAVFGTNNSSYKISKNDLATPLGKYLICSVDTNSRYHKFFKINYPNAQDAAEALKNGFIDEESFKRIISESPGDCVTAQTNLGAEIGIHGIGEYNIIFKNLPFVFNWTNGSIALSNENIDEIYSVAKIGTGVEITDR